MGSMSISSCRCCICVFCMHPVAVLNAATMLHDLQLVNAGRGCKGRSYGKFILQSQPHDCLIGSHECLRLFTPSCCGE